MSAYSTNIFALLDNDVEEATPEVVVPTAEQKKVKPVDKSRAQKNDSRRPDYPPRGGRTTIVVPSEERAPPRDRNVPPRFDRRNNEEGGRGGGYSRENNDRNDRGDRPRGDTRRGGRNGFRGRGREYDRQSGTGRVDTQRNETAAWGESTTNWSESATTSWGESTPSWDEPAPAAASTWDEQPNSNAWDEETSITVDANIATTFETETKPDDENVDNAAFEPEPEEKVKTLDEYLAEKANRSLSVSLPEARKPNEGSDDSKWKDAIQLEDEEDDDFIVGKEHSLRQKNKNKKEKVFLEIEQRFTERPGGRGRGGRGGFNDRRNGDDFRQERPQRGTFRGGRGGGGRGGRNSSNGVDVSDQDAFPSLGSK